MGLTLAELETQAATPPVSSGAVETPLEDAVRKAAATPPATETTPPAAPPETTTPPEEPGTGESTEPPKEGDQKIDGNEEGADAELDTDPITFWKSVDELTGVPIADKVQYNGIDPNSPEGIVLRDKVVMDTARMSMEQYLEETYPRAYAFLLHSSKGGSEEDFFKVKIPTLPEYESFKSNIDLQSKVYRDDLLNKGIDPDEADALVAAAVKKGTDELFKKSNAVYQRTQADVTKQLEDVKRANEAKEREEAARIQGLQTMISGTISSDKLGIVIPEVDRPAFTKFVNEMVREEDGQYYLVNPIDEKSINKLMESMYFYHKGGNLGALVQRRAKTMFVAKRVEAVKNGSNTMATAASSTKKIALGDM